MKKINLIIFFVLITTFLYAQEEKPTYNATALRDPFQDWLLEEKEKAVEEKFKEKPFPKFFIQGIILTEDLPMAIINNTIVKVGDKLEEAEVIKIDKEAVTFFYYGKEYKVSAPGYHLEKKGGKR